MGTIKKKSGKFYHLELDGKSTHVINFGHPASNSFVADYCCELTNTINELSEMGCIGYLLKSEGEKAFCEAASFELSC